MMFNKSVVKTKLITGFDFSHKLNDFIKDKKVLDIKYSCTATNNNYIHDRALVIYKEKTNV